jgi:hypothetical protein
VVAVKHITYCTILNYFSVFICLINFKGMIQI